MKQNNEKIIALASQCVRCGLCLPHCPTYQLGKEEPESPRGRIAILAATARAELEWDPTLQRHVDQCLACGHCERVCPAQVNYHELLLQGRQMLVAAHPPSWKKKLGFKVIETPFLRNLSFFMLRSMQKIGVWKLLIALTRRYSQKWANLMMLAPPVSQRVHIYAKPINRDVENVLLFSGCTGENFGASTLSAAKKLLARWGFSVMMPSKAFCCGALSAHAGFPEDTAKRTAQALSNFCGRYNVRHIISFATGCGSFNPEFLDIQKFLLDHWPAALPMRAAKKIRRIAVHSPCTQTNAMKSPNLSYDLLQRIPNIELIRFGENTCCGASGTYMLEHPERSQQWVELLLTKELVAGCDLIVTSNIGCQLHFQNFLRSNELSIDVRHPIEVLAEMQF